MKVVSIRFDDAIAQPATEAARNQGISLNEYVQRAVAAQLASDQRALREQVREEMDTYESVITYLAEH